MGLRNKMKNLIVNLVVILSILLSQPVFSGSAVELTHNYKDGAFYVFEGNRLIWKKTSDPAQMEVLKSIDDSLIFVLKFEPSFEVGDVWVYVFDMQEKEVSDTLKLLVLDDIDIGEDGVLIRAKNNRYGFKEPGAPLWPEFYRLKRGVFYQIDDMQARFRFDLLAKEAASFIGDAYLVCQGKVDGCFYQSEYEKAVQLLRDASHQITGASEN